jgi:hypothetical protein
MSQTTSAIPSPVARTSAGLRNALFDELDSLRQGASNTARANAVAKLAGQVVETVRMEIDVQKHVAKMAKEPTEQPLAITSVPLG